MTQSAESIRPPARERRLIWRVLQCICDLACRLSFGLQTFGIKNIPRDGGVLLLSNHQSFLDPVLVAVRLEREMAFLARATLFKGLFGWWIRLLNAFPIRQGRGDVGAMKATIELLKRGHVVLVFPEGSRTHDGEFAPLAPGVSLLIRRAGVPVVPVAIDGAFDAWPRHKRWPRPAKIRVSFGRPMRLDDADSVKCVEAEIRKLITQLRQIRSRN